MNPNERAVTVYGIANCDTVKKARAWLSERGIDCVFHDYKKLGVPLAPLERWMHAVGWEPLLNRKGTTWRKLDAQQQAAVGSLVLFCLICCCGGHDVAICCCSP